MKFRTNIFIPARTCFLLLFLALPTFAQEATIAPIGCSQTTTAWRAWQGFDQRPWDLVAGYGGGSIPSWADGIPNGHYWQRFELNREANGTAKVIWLQVCELEERPSTQAQVFAVIAELRRRLPEAALFVSPLAEFEDPSTCPKQNIQRSQQIVDLLVSSGRARRGPELPLVLREWIEAGDSGCHVGLEGGNAFGATLASWRWP